MFTHIGHSRPLCIKRSGIRSSDHEFGGCINTNPSSLSCSFFRKPTPIKYAAVEIHNQRRIMVRSDQYQEKEHEKIDGVAVSLDLLKQQMASFAKERNWGQFHTPRNLLLALVGEVGELSEIFQWKGEVPRGLPDWTEEEKQHLGEELSDVLLYLVQLSDICGVDLGNAALRKIQLNAIKYPPPPPPPNPLDDEQGN